MAKTVSFAASAIGSFWWEGGALLKRALAPQGIDLELDPTVSDYHNALSVAEGKNVLGITMPSFVDWAERRLGIFAGMDLPELRVVAALNLPVWLAATVDRASGIKTLKELAAKKYPWKAVLPPPQNQIGVYIERIMAAHGVTRESIIGWGGADLRPTRTRTEAERKAERAAGPAVLATQTAELARSGATNYIYAKADVPDDLVRAVLVALEDERILDNAHGFSYSGFRPQLVANLKLHRAADEYYKQRER